MTQAQSRTLVDFGSGMNPREGHIGIEIDNDKVQEAKKLGKKVEQGDICGKLDFKDDSVDEIWCKEVIEHLNHHEAFDMLKNAERILRPGGFITIYTLFARKSFWYTFDHVKPYPPQAIKKLLKTRNYYRKISFTVKDLKYKKLFGFYPVGYWITLEKPKQTGTAQ